MKVFSISDISHKRREVLKAAREGGAIIQLRNTNGKDILEEFVLTVKDIS